MNIITGNKIQTSKRTDYYPANHGCDCFTCTPFTPVENCFTSNGIRDWKIGSKGCCGCPSKPHCVSPDKRECSIGLSSKEKDPYKSIKWNKVSPNIECQYDINHIDTIDQVNNYRIKYEKNPLFKEHYTRIMRNFCNAVDTKNCIHNEEESNVPKFDPEDVKIIEKIHDNLLNGNKFIEENHWLFIYIIIVIILIIFLF
jgi:hypothetical protein